MTTKQVDVDAPGAIGDYWIVFIKNGVGTYRDARGIREDIDQCEMIEQKFGAKGSIQMNNNGEVRVISHDGTHFIYDNLGNYSEDATAIIATKVDSARIIIQPYIPGTGQPVEYTKYINLHSKSGTPPPSLAEKLPTNCDIPAPPVPAPVIQPVPAPVIQPVPAPVIQPVPAPVIQPPKEEKSCWLLLFLFIIAVLVAVISTYYSQKKEPFTIQLEV